MLESILYEYYIVMMSVYIFFQGCNIVRMLPVISLLIPHSPALTCESPLEFNE